MLTRCIFLFQLQNIFIHFISAENSGTCRPYLFCQEKMATRILRLQMLVPIVVPLFFLYMCSEQIGTVDNSFCLAFYCVIVCFFVVSHPFLLLDRLHRLVKFVLQLLSTRKGTLVLSGSLCCCRGFPFLYIYIFIVVLPFYLIH